jgi:hypothetical protein
VRRHQMSISTTAPLLSCLTNSRLRRSLKALSNNPCALGVPPPLFPLQACRTALLLVKGEAVIRIGLHLLGKTRVAAPIFLLCMTEPEIIRAIDEAVTRHDCLGPCMAKGGLGNLHTQTRPTAPILMTHGQRGVSQPTRRVRLTKSNSHTRMGALLKKPFRGSASAAGWPCAGPSPHS